MIILLVTSAPLHSRMPLLIDVCSVLYSPVLIRGYYYCCYLSFQCKAYDSDYIAVVLQMFIVTYVNRCLFCTSLA